MLTSAALAAATTCLAIIFGLKANATTLDDYPSFSPKFISNGMIGFLYHEKYGFADREGNVVIAPEYEYLGGFREEKVFGIRNGIHGFVSKAGTFQELPALRPIAAQARRVQFIRDYNVFLAVYEKSQGIVDASGKWLLKPKYEHIFFPRKSVGETKGTLWLEKKQLQFDPDTWEVTDDYIGAQLGNGFYASMEADFQYKIIDKNGKTISQERFSLLSPQENGAIKFSQKREKTSNLEGYLKIIDGKIKKTLTTMHDNGLQEDRVFACPPLPSTDTLGQYTAQMFHVNSGVCGYFDSDGNAITPPIYRFGTNFHKGKAVACKVNVPIRGKIPERPIECVWLDRDGRILAEKSFAGASLAIWSPADDQVAILPQSRKDGAYGYVFFYSDGRTKEFPSKPPGQAIGR